MADTIDWDALPDAEPDRRPNAHEIDWDTLPDAPKMDAGHAATLGVAQGGTFGFVDEIGGALARVLPQSTALPEWMRGVSSGGVKLGKAAMPNASDSPEVSAAKEALLRGEASRPDSYTLVRDKIREEAKQADKEQGAAFTAGKIAGGIGASVVGGIAGRAAPTLAPLAEGMSGAVLQGAAQGIGESEANDVTGMYADAATGAALGAAGHWVGNKVGQGVGRLASALPESVRNFAARRAMNAVGNINKDLKPLYKRTPEEVLERGQALLDEPGLIRAFDTVEDIAPKAQEALNETGRQIGQVLRQADASGVRFDVDPFINRVEQEILQPIAGDPVVAREAREVQNIINGYRELARTKGGLTFSEANALKSRLQNMEINWGNFFNDMSPSKNAQQYKEALQGIFLDEIDTQLGSATDDGTYQFFKALKDQYGTLKEAVRTSAEGRARMNGNNKFSLAEQISGLGAVSAAIATANPLPLVGAFGVPMASKLVRERGAATAAVAANRLANSDFIQSLAQVNPASLGNYAGVVTQAVARGNFPIVHYALWQKDPEYRATVERARKGAEQ